MKYILFCYNISYMISRQKIEVWKNLKAQDGFLHLNDKLIGI